MINIGRDCEIDLNKLIATRLLINANSGGGKSYAIRRIIEQTSGQVQQILIDLEGEFSTLREKFDFLLVGKDGEIPVNIKTAELLARKILELNVSTIIDVSELRHPERITFVKRFLDSLINLPKELWHPCLIFVDEAHQFCPESSKSESAGSVIDLMTRGRKRGYAGALATQRISKLNKDSVAEANNYMIGRTGLDIDMKRAGEILGFMSKEDLRSLRDLKAGEFYCFGPAFNHNGIKKCVVGKVFTTHPDSTRGINIKESSNTPDNIKKLLKDLVDLPKQADKEIKTVQDLKNEISRLKREITINRTSNVQVDSPKSNDDTHSEHKIKSLMQQNNVLLNFIKNFNQKAQRLVILETTKSDIPLSDSSESSKIKDDTKFQQNDLREPNINSSNTLGLAEKKIYTLLYQYPDKMFSKTQIGVFTGYSHKSGSFSNALSRLNTLGLIEKNTDGVKLKESNPDLIGSFDFSKESIIPSLGKCEKEIYDVVIQNSERTFTKQEIADLTPSQYSAGSGSFSNSLSKLNSLGIIIKKGNSIRLNPELLEI